MRQRFWWTHKARSKSRKRLCRLAKNRSLREKLYARGLARAPQFSWETAVEKTWEVYRELLG